VHVRWLDGSRTEVGTIYGVGRNYVLHAKELGNAVPTEPVVFLKARTSLRGLDPAPLAFDESFHHEVELVLVVGAPVPLRGDPGWAAVSGVTLGLDLTRREVQQRCKEQGLPWVPAKSFAGGAVVGPIVPVADLGGTAGLRFSLDVNGERRQEGDPASMVFDVPALLRYLASLAPLLPGDLVFTGTPSGVGPIRAGDAFVMRLVTGAGTHTFTGLL
jgi:2-keto-4-pentenoate hydratase/2-oxohepta-3-ene-1,7-dioic acid hydratase in catechol pathway